MGRAGLLYTDVEKAIEQLHNVGKSPTVDNIRNLIGTGSKSTIARYLREWKTNNDIATPTEGALPSDLLTLVKGLWEHMQQKTAQQINEYRNETEQKIQSLRQELLAAKKQHEKQQHQIHVLEENYQQEINTHREAQRILAQEQLEKATLLERNQRLESQLTHEKSETTRLHQLLNHMQKNLEHYQASIQQQREQQQLAFDKERQTFQSQMNELQQQLTVEVGKKCQAESKWQQCETQLNDLEECKKAQELTILKMQHELNSTFVKIETIHQQNQNLLQNKAVIEIEYKAQTKELAEQTAQFKLTEQQLEKLNQLLDHANDKIHLLREEKDFIAHEKSNLVGQLKQLQTRVSVSMSE